MKTEKKQVENYDLFNVTCEGFSGYRDLEPKSSIIIGSTERNKNKYYEIRLSLIDIYGYRKIYDEWDESYIIGNKVCIRISEQIKKENEPKYNWEKTKEFVFESYPEFLEVLNKGVKIAELKKQFGNIDVKTITLKQVTEMIQKLKRLW
ncbi:hypothetical protein B5F77_03525 [Parabacteroides sp. An277]|uniref:hypothetical protein n=1 Tax=Parabacteroides sp. An277 TaxID=1965619 RepID=UPI000B3B01F6|nr:hypothetical protein [Parabacteroides sp. An277]OUO54273.1 hypothetical protein B5F77_03525 [Parabacteroides sp. An277]